MLYAPVARATILVACLVIESSAWTFPFVQVSSNAPRKLEGDLSEWLTTVAVEQDPATLEPQVGSLTSSIAAVSGAKMMTANREWLESTEEKLYSSEEDGEGLESYTSSTFVADSGITFSEFMILSSGSERFSSATWSASEESSSFTLVSRDSSSPTHLFSDWYSTEERYLSTAESFIHSTTWQAAESTHLGEEEGDSTPGEEEGGESTERGESTENAELEDSTATELGDEESTDLGEDEFTELEDEESTELGEEDATEQGEEDSTEQGVDESTELEEEESTKLGEDESTELEEEESTELGEEESTELGEEESTKLGDDESTELGEEESTELGEEESSELVEEESTELEEEESTELGEEESTELGEEESTELVEEESTEESTELGEEESTELGEEESTDLSTKFEYSSGLSGLENVAESTGQSSSVAWTEFASAQDSSEFTGQGSTELTISTDFTSAADWMTSSIQATMLSTETLSVTAEYSQSSEESSVSAVASTSLETSPVEISTAGWSTEESTSDSYTSDLATSVSVAQESSHRILVSSSELFSSLDSELSEEAAPLSWIPQKRVGNKMPLEALVEESDLSFLGGAVRSNPKYELLRKVGMTIFAPVDSAFQGLPIDLKKLRPAANSSASFFQLRQSGRDAESEANAKPPGRRRQLGARKNRYVPPEAPINCATQADPGSPLYEECILVQGSAWQQLHSRASPVAPDPPLEGNGRDRMQDFEQLIMYHVVRRQIPPGLVESKGSLSFKTEMKNRQLTLTIVDEESGNPALLLNGGDARVVEIVTCRNGFIYKIDGPLFPAWNLGVPTLIDLIRMTPHYSKLRFLLDESHLFDRWAKAGPITTLLIPDDGWRLDGLPVPPCFFKALVRESNQATLMKLLKWVTIPGIWTKENIQSSDWLPNGVAPSLGVVNIKAALSPDVTTLIEGKEVISWDIELYNGLAHVISELPLRPDIDLRGILWDCLDALCHECPVVTKYVLRYLDDGGLLPDVNNPKTYIIPPGVRPEWVCADLDTWFPPGWDLHEWRKYLQSAKTRSNSAQSLAHAGWRKAAVRTADLIDKLDEAEVHLRKLWHLYGDSSSYVMGLKEEPLMYMGWLKNRRSLELKPKICEESGPKKPGQLLDRDVIWDGVKPWADGLSPYSPRSDYLGRLEREKRRDFGMEDLRSVAQWIR